MEFVLNLEQAEKVNSKRMVKRLEAQQEKMLVATKFFVAINFYRNEI